MRFVPLPRAPPKRQRPVFRRFAGRLARVLNVAIWQRVVLQWPRGDVPTCRDTLINPPLNLPGEYSPSANVSRCTSPAGSCRLIHEGNHDPDQQRNSVGRSR